MVRQGRQNMQYAPSFCEPHELPSKQGPTRQLVTFEMLFGFIRSLLCSFLGWFCEKNPDLKSNLYGISSDGNFYNINRDTGLATLVGETGLTNRPNGGATDPNTGRLYTITQRPQIIYEIDPANGKASMVKVLSGVWICSGLAINSQSDIFAKCRDEKGYTGVYEVDMATGQATLVVREAHQPLGSGVDALAFDAEDHLYSTDKYGELRLYDLATGNYTEVANINYDASALEYDPLTSKMLGTGSDDADLVEIDLDRLIVNRIGFTQTEYIRGLFSV
jgi:DNA-binding beta-propeller fold protein YncE